MDGVMDAIVSETSGRRFQTHKFCYDTTGSSVIAYDNDEDVQWRDYGETTRPTKCIDLRDILGQLLGNGQESCFAYFLDGSRHTYKVDDMAFGKEVYPVLAGQVGISCCRRENKEMRNEFFHRKLVVVLPSRAVSQNADTREKNRKEILRSINAATKLQRHHILFEDVLFYPRDKDEKYEKKGVACIQDFMVEQEKLAVRQLVAERKVKAGSYLIKDGTLEYKAVNDGKRLNFSEKRFREDFRHVIGVSKSFNPMKCYVKGGTTDSKIVATLPLYHRTPACCYESKISGNGVYFCVWYLRIRDSKHTQNVFDGILKIEKLMDKDEYEHGVDTDRIDYLSAQLLRERLPVCYGDDKRWANHLYPIYVTEQYAKSKYISNDTFMNLF